MPGCPFYGFRWPERSSNLRQTDGNECGLDFDRNATCRMEIEGSVIDYYQCPVVASARVALHAGKDVITFHTGDKLALTLAEWENRYSRSRGGELPGKLPDNR
jgi:hypothetical protein